MQTLHKHPKISDEKTAFITAIERLMLDSPSVADIDTAYRFLWDADREETYHWRQYDGDPEAMEDVDIMSLDELSKYLVDSAWAQSATWNELFSMPDSDDAYVPALRTIWTAY